MMPTILSDSAVSRRSLAVGTAWAAPVILGSAHTPVYVASRSARCVSCHLLDDRLWSGGDHEAATPPSVTVPPVPPH